MEEINMQNARKVAIDITKANVVAVVIMLLAAIIFIVPFFIIWKDRPIEELFSTGSNWGLFFLFMIVGIVVHELIHGITWACFAKSGWKSISFGVMWKLLTPYCHCSEPMRKHPYMLGAMMPFVVLGVLPAILGLVICSLPVVVWGVFFIAAAAGDIWMTWLLTKEPADCLVLDHPSEAGFYIIDETASPEYNQELQELKE